MNWFEQFAQSLKGEKASADLVGAGTASYERAMAHYRYQHQAKVREAIEETFPITMQLLDEQWDDVWEQYWQSSPASPRSLDFVAEIFVNYLLTTQLPSAVKELARFEWRMDVHPWTHRRLAPIDISNLTVESKLLLAPLDVQSFAAPVAKMYNSEELTTGGEEKILFWMKESGTHFRVMQDWELSVLARVGEGLAVALESAPEDEASVNEFFQWLGSSGLIREIHND